MINTKCMALQKNAPGSKTIPHLPTNITEIKSFIVNITRILSNSECDFS